MILCVTVLLLVSFAPLDANVLSVARNYGANQLVSLLNTAELGTILRGHGPYTLFAPTDKAFSELPAGELNKLKGDKELLREVLSHHVLSTATYSSKLKNDLTVNTLEGGPKLRINIYSKVAYVEGCKIILADNNASNGVVHMIDKVIYPIPTKDVVGLASETPDLSTLVYAIIRANLQETLEGGPFTVFAPNNAAFDKLPPGKLSDLLSNETELVDLLTYHVTPGTKYSVGLRDGMELMAVDKKELRITTRGGVKVNDAVVVEADVRVTNGIVHVINTVLVPPA